MQRITRGKPLGPEEADKYKKIRQQIDAELPELLARHKERIASREEAKAKEEEEIG